MAVGEKFIKNIKNKDLKGNSLKIQILSSKHVNISFVNCGFGLTRQCPWVRTTVRRRKYLYVSIISRSFYVCAALRATQLRKRPTPYARFRVFVS